MPTDWEKVRAEFPALSSWTYLNTATFGQLPLRTVEAVSSHFAHRDDLACSDFLAWFDDADRVRAQVAQLIHCSAEDVAFVPNASTGLSLFLSGIAWKAGDQVLVLENEFPNNIYAPLTQPVEFVEAPWERFYDSVTSRTRAVLMSTASYTNGFQPPLEEIGKFLRERGVLFYLDGTQSLGARVFDTRKIQPDMLSVHGYKWLLSPNGSGFIYVRPEARQWLRPAVVGWRSDQNWRNVDDLNHGAPVFTDSAEKYEGAMLPFPSIYALGASVGIPGDWAGGSRASGVTTCRRDSLRSGTPRWIRAPPHFAHSGGPIRRRGHLAVS